LPDISTSPEIDAVRSKAFGVPVPKLRSVRLERSNPEKKPSTEFTPVQLRKSESSRNSFGTSVEPDKTLETPRAEPISTTTVSSDISNKTMDDEFLSSKKILKDIDSKSSESATAVVRPPRVKPKVPPRVPARSTSQPEAEQFSHTSGGAPIASKDYTPKSSHTELINHYQEEKYEIDGDILQDLQQALRIQESLFTQGNVVTQSKSKLKTSKSFRSAGPLTLNQEPEVGSLASTTNNISFESTSENGQARFRASETLTDASKPTSPAEHRHQTLKKNSRFNMSMRMEIESPNLSARTSRSPTAQSTWSRRVGDEVISLMEKEEAKRQEAINEFIETEIAFTEDMEMVLEAYWKPLCEHRILGESDIEAVFANLPEIHSLSQKFAKKLQERQIEMNGIIEDFGDLLVEHLPIWTRFEPFCSRLSIAAAVIQEKKKSSPAFANLLSEAMKNTYFGKMDLNSYLLKPMQRLTKIPLLIKGILKHTPAKHSDYELLIQAESIAEKVLTRVNIACGEVEERRKLEMYQERLAVDLAFDFGPSHLQPMIRQIKLVDIVEINDKKIHLFLFEDCVVAAQLKMVNKVEKFVLFRPSINLWLAQIYNSDSQPRTPETKNKSGPRYELQRNTSRKGFRASSQETFRAIVLHDGLNGQQVEMVFPTSSMRDKWARTIEQTQQDLWRSSFFAVERLKPLPGALWEKRKRPVAIDYQNAVNVGFHVLFGNIEGILVTPANTSELYYELAPMKQTKISSIIVDTNTQQLLVVEGLASLFLIAISFL
jgi:hypothetical protein